MTLVPIHNLDMLNEKQKVEYLQQVCEHFQIPAHLNLLEFINMEAGDGAKHMVLYAKKGATDMLREKHGISIVDLQQTITSQAAIFTAKAQDKSGRTEIAVGASSIEGLIGRELANQIMIAQTRATRRVTLQFVGGGFLDESEVFQSQSTNINSLASMSEAVSNVAKQPVQPTVNATAPKEGRTKEQIDAQEALDKMTKGRRLPRQAPTFSLQVTEEDNHPCTAEAEVKSANADIPESQPTATPDIKPAETSAQIGVMIPQGVPVQIIAGKELPAIVPDIKADTVPELSTVVPVLDTPNEEQMKVFKNRLRTYTDEVFPQAGMVPSEGLGGVTMKVRLYTMARYKVLDLKKLTVAQWDDLFAYFDKTDAKLVVTQIEEAITSK